MTIKKGRQKDLNDFARTLAKNQPFKNKIHHCAVVLKDFFIKLATGYNCYEEQFPGCQYGRHAEQDALGKVKPIKNGRKKRNKIFIDLLVIRVTPGNNLALSTPCDHCRKIMRYMTPEGYAIRYIHYSKSDGTIASEKLRDFENNFGHVSRRFRSEYYEIMGKPRRKLTKKTPLQTQKNKKDRIEVKL